MDLVVSGNGTVSGTSKIVSGNYYAIVNVVGTVSGSQFSFSETGITSQIPVPGVQWCLKAGTLTMKDATLSGNWHATSPASCLPGAISLTKATATS
jgi:hypothetical protein